MVSEDRDRSRSMPLQPERALRRSAFQGRRTCPPEYVTRDGRSFDAGSEAPLGPPRDRNRPVPPRPRTPLPPCPNRLSVATFRAGWTHHSDALSRQLPAQALPPWNRAPGFVQARFCAAGRDDEDAFAHAFPVEGRSFSHAFERALPRRGPGVQSTRISSGGSGSGAPFAR